MERYDIVIIGGGPAGVQAAISARYSNPNARIGLIRREKKAMIPCGIPYTLHSLASVDDDILPDKPLDINRIELIVGEVVERLDHKLRLSDGRSVSFRRLVLATGSSPVVPDIPGMDLEGIHLVNKEYESICQLRREAEEANRVLIVGGGFIGLEMADELLQAGKQVTVVEKLPRFLAQSFDPEYGERAQRELERLGADIVLGQSVTHFIGDQAVAGVVLESGRQIPADLVIVSVGFAPRVDIPKMFGVQCLKGVGILVDEHMRTSEPDIFAAGDCTAHKNWITGNPFKVMLASTAMAQGRLAGSNLFNISLMTNFPGTLGTFSTRIGKLVLGVSGLTEQDANQMHLEYVTGKTKSPDRHPGKLEGASQIELKLLFSKHSNVLVGAQVIGGASAGELINMLSVMIQKRMTAMEIDTIQIGTHPLLTSSPLAYPVITATVDAIMKWYWSSSVEKAVGLAGSGKDDPRAHSLEKKPETVGA